MASLAGGPVRWKPGLHHALSSKGKRREARVHCQPAGSEQGEKEETFAGV